MVGIFLAAVILASWIVSLLLLLLVDPSTIPIVGVIFAILIRTFLHTGLFVIGHDAMHNSLLPNNRRINRWLGAIAVGLYASISYSKCCLNHQKHHHHPGQIHDPDFHDGTHTQPLCWYLKFIREYITVASILKLIGGWGLLLWGMSQFFQVFWSSVALFGMLPFVLSSVQLFVFGTYFPHRMPNSRVTGDRSSDHLKNQPKIHPKIHLKTHWGLWLWSFFTCYHFGFYHQVHHQFPKVPWHKLPVAQTQADLPLVKF